MSALRVERVPDVSLSCHSADDLLAGLVQYSDATGRFHGHPALMAGLFWEQGIPAAQMTAWLDELVARGDVEVRRVDGKRIAYIQHRARFDRYRNRQAVPLALRRLVMERDGYRCQECGSENQPTLDHIIPFSRGGPDTEENLRVLCRPCNSSKGARVQ